MRFKNRLSILVSVLVLSFILVTPVLADTSVVINNDGSDQFGFGLTSNYTQNAQGFSVSGQNYFVKTVTAYLRIVGSPADQVFITINTNNPSGDVPSSTVVATSNNQTITTETNYTWTVNTEVELTAGTQYWFVFKRTGALNDSNYYRTHATGSGTYPNGRLSRNAGVNDWSEGLTGYDHRMSFVWDIYVPPVEGCTDEEANNYNPLAEVDDGSCDYGVQYNYTGRMNGTDVHDIAETSVAEPIGSLAKNKLPTILGILAALIALGVSIYLFYRWVSGRSVSPTFFGHKMLSQDEWESKGGRNYKGSMFKD